MVIDYRERRRRDDPSAPPPTYETHVVVDAETGEDLSHLGYYYADDEAGLLLINVRNEAGSPFVHDPRTGHRPTKAVSRARDADGNVLYDYGAGYLSPRRPEIATARVFRDIRIVRRPPAAGRASGAFDPAAPADHPEFAGMRTWSVSDRRKGPFDNHR